MGIGLALQTETVAVWEVRSWTLTLSGSTGGAFSRPFTDLSLSLGAPSRELFEFGQCLRVCFCSFLVHSFVLGGGTSNPFVTRDRSLLRRSQRSLPVVTKLPEAQVAQLACCRPPGELLGRPLAHLRDSPGCRTALWLYPIESPGCVHWDSSFSILGIPVNPPVKPRYPTSTAPRYPGESREF